MEKKNGQCRRNLVRQWLSGQMHVEHVLDWQTKLDIGQYYLRL
jgi:hypothetical protein